MLAISSLFLALTLAQAAPAPEQAGRISGRVTVEGAGTPLAGVRVMLMPTAPPTGPRGMPPQALTDQDGRYVFERIAPGAYRVHAEKSGYASIGDMGQGPTLKATGQPVVFDLQLQKGAVITGRILDARGEPVTDARIMILRRMTAPAGAPAFRGMPRMIPAGAQNQQTNDLGDYRVAGLAPGEYFVAAAPRPLGMLGGPGVPASNPPPTGRSARTAIATTFYPGTTDQAAAQPIAVAAGAEVGNISFAVQSRPAFRVAGVVVDEDGHPAAGAMVSLTGDPRDGAMFMGPAGMMRTQDDGRFVIDDVVPGRYRAHATILVTYYSGDVATAGVSGGASGGAVVSGSSGAVASWSSNSSSSGTMEQPIEVVVTDADVSGVRIVARRPVRR